MKVISILKGFYSDQTMLSVLAPYGPYQVLIATILSARAKDETTLPISLILFEKYPTASKLAVAKIDDVIEIIKPIGFFNVKAKNIITTSKMLVERFNSTVPDNLGDLLSLPGVGRKVANCVLVYSFGQRVIPVDIHVHRISNRLGWVKTNTPEQTEVALMKIIDKKFWVDINEVFVNHGKNICLPRNPLCGECPVSKFCPTSHKTP